MAKYFKLANACVEFPDTYNLPIPPSFTEIDHSTYVELTQNSIPRLDPPTPDPQMDDITALQLAVAELAETQAADQTANELALAELAETIGG